MASEEEYDSMEELALVEDMSKKIEGDLQGEQAQARKPRPRKPKPPAATAAAAETPLEEVIAAREKQIKENELKMLHLDISIQKIKTNMCKCVYELRKLDPGFVEAGPV